jgi:hypothetical protein
MLQCADAQEEAAMATWITHLRLAEYLIACGLSVDVDSFLAGSVSPDAGVPKPDGSGYDPPKKITHWHTARRRHDVDTYQQRYLKRSNIVLPEKAFHIGYYLHLLADHEWDERVWQPKKRTPLYQAATQPDSPTAREIKMDWYGLDFIYLRDHAECVYWTRFRYIERVPDYLDYLSPGLLTANIEKIVAYYRSPAFNLMRPYHYLSQAEIDAYVAVTGEVLLAACRERGWME